MISEQRFIKKIKELYPAISKEDISEFYNFIILSYVFYRTGYLGFCELYEMEKKKSFSLFNKIGASKGFWEKMGAEKITAEKISSFIKKEKELKINKGSIVEFKKVIYARIKLYPKIFGFSNEELTFCEIMAEEYKKEHYRKK